MERGVAHAEDKFLVDATVVVPNLVFEPTFDRVVLVDAPQQLVVLGD